MEERFDVEIGWTGILVVGIGCRLVRGRVVGWDGRRDGW